MSTTVFSGPILVYGQNTVNGITDYNPDLGTSLFFGGVGTIDPRGNFNYFPGESQSAPDFGWLGSSDIATLNLVPYSAGVGAISASAAASSATLTLVSANSATTGVYMTQTFTRSDTGVVDNNSGAGLVALDSYVSVTASFSNGVMTVTSNTGMPIGPGMVVISTSGTISQGSAGATSGSSVAYQLTTTGSTPVAQGYAGTYQMFGNLTATSGTVTLAYPNVLSSSVPTNATSPSVYLWSAQGLVGRAVGVTAAVGATATTATVSGYDAYGYPMVENITISAGAQAAGKKAFRYIKSVVLNASDAGHNYSVDTINVFGFPIRSDQWSDVLINSGASLTAPTLVTSATGYVPGDKTTPSAITGDVRGTYAFTASTGANKLVVRQIPQAYLVPTPTTLYGLTQYSNF